LLTSFGSREIHSIKLSFLDLDVKVVSLLDFVFICFNILLQHMHESLQHAIIRVSLRLIFAKDPKRIKVIPEWLTPPSIRV